MNKAIQWIDEVRGADSVREVSRVSGVNQATLNRQINNGALTFETVRDVSRAYGRTVLADLVKTGFLIELDVAPTGIENALHAASDEQLLLAIADRLNVSTNRIFDQPVSEALHEANNITHMQWPDVRNSRKNDQVANETIDEAPVETDSDFDNA